MIWRSSKFKLFAFRTTVSLVVTILNYIKTSIIGKWVVMDLDEPIYNLQSSDRKMCSKNIMGICACVEMDSKYSPFHFEQPMIILPEYQKLNNFIQGSNLVLSKDTVTLKRPKPKNVQVEYTKFLSSLNLNTDLRKKFSIDPNVVFLNHGSYGSIPTGVRTIQQAWTNAFDRQPIQFFDHFFPYMASSIRCVADFINVEPANIVLVPNATTATKTVLNNLNIQASDTILVTSLMYDAVDCTVGEISSRIGCTINVLTLTVPTSPKAIIDAFANYFKTCTKLPRLAILDHITSATALVFPIKEIVQICRNYGVLTIVDGAHAVGSVPIDLKGLECDFYFSNLHKWSFTPIGTAFLYVHPKHQESFRPLLVSYGYPLGFQAEFMYVGTMDYTPYLTIDAGIAFYQSIPNLMERNHQLCLRTSDFLCKLLNGFTLYQIGHDTYENLIGCMAIIVLPHFTKNHPTSLKIKREPKLFCDHHSKNERAMEPFTTNFLTDMLHDQLLYHHQIEVMTRTVNDCVAIRISCQCYNTPEEYIHLGKVLYTILYDQPLVDNQLITDYLKDTLNLRYDGLKNKL